VCGEGRYPRCTLALGETPRSLCGAAIPVTQCLPVECEHPVRSLESWGLVPCKSPIEAIRVEALNLFFLDNILTLRRVLIPRPLDSWAIVYNRDRVEADGELVGLVVPIGLSKRLHHLLRVRNYHDDATSGRLSWLLEGVPDGNRRVCAAMSCPCVRLGLDQRRRHSEGRGLRIRDQRRNGCCDSSRGRRVSTSGSPVSRRISRLPPC
jgi:hypothetical protein